MYAAARRRRKPAAAIATHAMVTRRLQGVRAVVDEQRRLLARQAPTVQAQEERLPRQLPLGGQCVAEVQRVVDDELLDLAGNLLGQPLRRLDSLDLLVRGMGQLNSLDTLVDYIARVRLDSASPDWDSDRKPGVSLLTLHSAKGLEFSRVYLVGFEKELLPHKKSVGHPASITEERRLCYVGMTRAMDRLTLTVARSRTRRNERIPRQPSMFLEEIPEVLLDQEEVISSVKESRRQRNLEYLAQIRAMLEADD